MVKGGGRLEEMIEKERHSWSSKEEDVLTKYFSGGITQLTLYKNLLKVNPNRTYEAMKHRIRKMREDGHIQPKDAALNKLRVGYLDIEASDLRADWGYMLTWYIKTEGKKEYLSGRITQKEVLRGEFDKRITKELLDALKSYDVVWTHYGSDFRFDMPYIRTRALVNGFGAAIPQKAELYVKDTYPLVKKKLKLQSNRLANVSEVLGIKEKKSPVTPRMWQLARIGDKKALDYVDEHNKRDVEVLELVHQKLKCIDNTPYTSI